MSPSKRIPFIPNTDLLDKLKRYGEAELTVSISTLTFALVIVGNGLFGAEPTTYLNCVSDTISDTTWIPSYPEVAIPEIRIGVSIERSVRLLSISTVITVPEAEPSPALIDEIPTCCPLEPTIRYSSTLVWKSILPDGKSGSIGLPVPAS